MSTQTMNPNYSVVESNDTTSSCPLVSTGSTAGSRRISRSSMRGFGTLLTTEAKVWSRDLSTPIFALLFPALLLAVNALMSSEMTEPISTTTMGETAAQFYGTHWYGNTLLSVFLPRFLVWGLAMGALAVMPGAFAAFRDKGVLRRFAASPMRPGALISAHLVLNAAAGIAAAIIAIAVAHFAFGSVANVNNVFTVVIGILLGLTAMCAIGAVIGSRSNKPTVVSGIGTAVMMVMALLSGAMGGSFNPESTLFTIGRYTPFGAAMQVIDQGWFGTGFPWLYAIVLLAWTVIGTALAAKLFKWS